MTADEISLDQAIVKQDGLLIQYAWCPSKECHEKSQTHTERQNATARGRQRSGDVSTSQGRAETARKPPEVKREARNRFSLFAPQKEPTFL